MVDGKRFQLMPFDTIYLKNWLLTFSFSIKLRCVTHCIGYTFIELLPKRKFSKRNLHHLYQKPQ